MPVNAADRAWGFVNEVRLILAARCRPLFLHPTCFHDRLWSPERLSVIDRCLM